MGQRGARRARVVARRPLHARRSRIGFGLSRAHRFCVLCRDVLQQALGEAGYLPAFIAAWFPTFVSSRSRDTFARRANG
jgi:hypothetical protein